jgi:hypothetical protein
MFNFLKGIFSSNKNLQVEINPAREMLKEATVLKKEKKYDEACDKLKQAFLSKGASDLMAKERMRLPMYLQLAKKNDEGWKILNEINVEYTDVFSQAEIANQMRVFLQKEKNYIEAILFSIWNICKEVERDRFNIQRSINLTDQWALNKEEFGSNEEEKETVYGKTPKGNPITDSTYKMFNDRVNKNISKSGVSDNISTLLRKAKKEELIDSLSKSISKFLHSSKQYELREVRKIIKSILLED